MINVNPNFSGCKGILFFVFRGSCWPLAVSRWPLAISLSIKMCKCKKLTGRYHYKSSIAAARTFSELASS